MVQVPQYSRSVGAARPDATPIQASTNDGLARGVAGASVALDEVVLVNLDREATAAAKERDALVSDQIRALMYDPETGFANLRGADAVNAQKTIAERLDEINKTALDGLSPAAQRKVDAQIRNRVASAKQSADIHTAAERRTWLDGASNARIEAAHMDALTNPAATQASINVIRAEIRDRADRDGWAPEQTQMALEKGTSKVYADQVARIAASNPVAAMEYMRANQGKMTGEDVTRIEAALQPEVKRYVGRAVGREAFASTGDMSGAMVLAATNIGLNEVQQREAVREYLANGGQNLDPTTTAWCAAFVNATLAQAGMGGTGSLAARSFLDWGEEVTQPKRGDVVVLTRGDPNGAQGHVGFFDGYDENGDVKVLGGNQKNSVNVSTYSAGRVLGFRRMPDTTNTTGAMKRILDIEDPEERQAALEEFNLRVAVSRGQAQEQRQAAVTAAENMLISGTGSVADLDLEFRQTLGLAAMESLQRSEAMIRSRGFIETDDMAFYQLSQMAASNPEQFRAVNLMEYRDKLSQSDFQRFVAAQTEPPNRATEKAASTLMSTAQRQIRAAGIENDSEEEAAIQSQLLRWQTGFIAENGRAPDMLEIDQMVGKLMLPVVINESWRPFDEFDGRMFDLPSLDLDAAGLATSDIKIGGTTIPQAIVNEQIIAMQEEGEEVTPETLVDRIYRLGADAGLF